MPVAAEKKEFSSELLCQEADGMYEKEEYMREPVIPALKPVPQMETAIVFDWDDTLLASSVLASKGYRLDGTFERCPETEEQLRLLERAVCNLLKAASMYGSVHIVTNAEQNWVQMSAAKFMPAVIPYLQLATIVSARTTFESTYPGQPLQWKIAAMTDRLHNSFQSPTSLKNIMSFGDSHVEREAVKIAAGTIRSTRTKSIKFVERPTIEQLRRQLELMLNCIQNLFAHDGDLDLMLQITPDAAPAVAAATATGPRQQQVTVQA